MINFFIKYHNDKFVINDNKFKLVVKNHKYKFVIKQIFPFYSAINSQELGMMHRTINDRMENSIKGSRIGYNLR